MEYFQFSQEEALEVLGVDPRRGLSRGEVQRRRAKYGKNQLETAKRRGVLRQFLGQFQDLMVLILLAAAAACAYWCRKELLVIWSRVKKICLSWEGVLYLIFAVIDVRV